MFRKLGYGLLCAGSLLSTNALAINHDFRPGISIEYELPPNDPQEFTNSWFWTITSTCTVRTRDNSDEIFIEVLKKSGKINGQPLSQGDTLSMIVHNGEKFVITADSGGKVKLTNRGLSTIVASCST
ncbi:MULTISPECIES: hypothetical protein [unclassified Legionella]|uniref:hypothetical protein n=1 Tax=unclassified Legionella TaxID=2622702 RepID=UPI0010563A8E|nr:MULTISPECIES: hypothetical protein [unclassified Legionella]MDI9818605.1 hypothetical protein [Legionella sp. PL877]